MASRRRIKDILDSDDELPITYEDIAVTPAYQDDNRFSEKAIYLLTKGDDDSSEYSSQLSSMHNSDSEQELEKTESKENQPSYLHRGVLSRKDAYCIKVLGTVFNDDTLLWFIKFTIAKDMQSNYNFLTSCLASEDQYCKSKNHIVNNISQKNTNCDKKIVFDYK